MYYLVGEWVVVLDGEDGEWCVGEIVCCDAELDWFATGCGWVECDEDRRLLRVVVGGHGYTLVPCRVGFYYLKGMKRCGVAGVTMVVFVLGGSYERSRPIGYERLGFWCVGV